jgi:hypothetical protein
MRVRWVVPVESSMSNTALESAPYPRVLRMITIKAIPQRIIFNHCPRVLAGVPVDVTCKHSNVRYQPNEARRSDCICSIRSVSNALCWNADPESLHFADV